MRQASDLGLLCFLLVAIACRSTRPIPLLETAAPLLRDCSRDYSIEFEEEVPEIPEDDRRLALVAASNWAVEACYSPCDYPMCAAVTKADSKRISVYVTSDEWSAQDPPGTIVLRIKPEAELQLRRSDFAVVKAHMFHSGCRWASNDCKMEIRQWSAA